MHPYPPGFSHIRRFSGCGCDCNGRRRLCARGRYDCARIISTFRFTACCSRVRIVPRITTILLSKVAKKLKNASCTFCCREVRHRIRLRGQDAGDRMRRGQADPPDTGELWQVLHHDMQWAREHGVERQLHVAQIVPRAEQRVSTARAVFVYVCLFSWLPSFDLPWTCTFDLRFPAEMPRAELNSFANDKCVRVRLKNETIEKAQN